jgi:hypothetical protein
LPLGVDVEAGLAVVVPGAAGYVAATGAAQLEVLADQFDDVRGLPDAFFGVIVRHRKLLALGVACGERSSGPIAGV